MAPFRTPGPAFAPPHAVRAHAVAPGESAVDVAKSSVFLRHHGSRHDVARRGDAPSPRRSHLLDGTPPSARLSVNLDSFDSSIPLRNERVRGIFFETWAIGWETADVTLPSIPADVVQTLRVDKLVSHVTLDATLKVHGRTAPLSPLVNAGYTDDGRIWVKTAAPAQVKISDLGLTSNLHRLSAICMHDSIDNIVNVTASFEFAAR